MHAISSWWNEELVSGCSVPAKSLSPSPPSARPQPPAQPNSRHPPPEHCERANAGMNHGPSLEALRATPRASAIAVRPASEVLRPSPAPPRARHPSEHSGNAPGKTRACNLGFQGLVPLSTRPRDPPTTLSHRKTVCCNFVIARMPPFRAFIAQWQSVSLVN